MKRILFYLFMLSVLTACQVVRVPKKRLVAEQVILTYFLDSLVPNDPHLKGRTFEFDFVVRQGIGDWVDHSHAGVSGWQYVASYEAEDSTFKYLRKGKENFIARAPLRLKPIPTMKKIKYEDGIHFFRNYFIIPRGIDTAKVDFSRTDEGTIYLGSQYSELPNGSFYTMSRLQVIYVQRNKLYDKSYYFILRNNSIKYILLYTSNHKEPYGEGTKDDLLTP